MQCSDLTQASACSISATLHPLIVGGLIKKSVLAVFQEEINGEGVTKWKWADFFMQCLNRGLSIVVGGKQP